MTGQIILFIIYSALIVIIAKYMLYYCVRRIAGILKFKNKTIGQILGYLTSMPELISTLFIAQHGMILTVTYNVLSSNVINIILAIIVTGAFGRFKYLKGNKFRIEYIIIAFSIIFPMLMIKFNMLANASTILICLVLYLLYLYIIRKLGLEPQEEMFKEVEEESEKKKYNIPIAVTMYSIIILTGICLLYFLGDKLGDIVYSLGSTYKVSELILGIIIGFITSMPEMTTFIESYVNNKGKNEHKGAEELVNNVVASNVANLLIIQAIGILIFMIFNT